MRIAFAVAETIREAREAPAGIVFAALSHYGCDLQTFDRIIGLLVSAGVVQRTPSHLLRWVEPKAA